MIRIDVRSAHGDYPVLIGPDVLEALPEHLSSCGGARPRSLVTDAVVGPLHADRVAAALDLATVVVPEGETNKTWTAVETICRSWLAEGLDRRATVVALGGGIVTDIVGFAAAVFLRGIGWIAAPTTLLGMVDAAVGGKTGVNLPEGKNLIGAFWPPMMVVADTRTLATLPPRQLRAGLAEVVKTAWIGDHDMLRLIPDAGSLASNELEPENWERLVARSVTVKAAVVAEDEREAGRRRSLNLGHTLGHALEAATDYRRFLHGEAVAWGLEAAAILGRRHGVLSARSEQELRSATRRLGRLPAIDDLDPERVCRFIATDKKRDAHGVAWVLPTDDGVALDQRVETSEAVEVLRELQRG
jgi:3-dehydroquinate synthase